MLRLPRFSLSLVVLVLALGPGVAHGQSGAGNEQYQDPFAGQQSGAGANPGSGGGKLGAAPGTAAPQAPVANPAAAGTTATAPGLPAELARTGADVRILFAAGLLLLICGLTLRRRPNGRR